MHSYPLLIYACNSNNNSEEASTDPNVSPKQSIIKGASLVVYPKGHVEVSLYAPLNIVEEKRERQSNVAGGRHSSLRQEKIYIPQDVVSYILTFIRRGQLSVCSRVCKLWRLLTSDPYPLLSFLIPITTAFCFLKGCDFY